ncbi:MAG: hypothetical protein LBS25_05045, partial [Candidatus Symbiothrix sp.]|nr:hypothetical protein [Candidatus Symbiothrix sp.]
MKAICFSLALIVTVFAGYAQSDSLSVQERIANKAPSKSTLIVDTRNFLIDDFLDGNKQSVAEIMQYQSQEIDDEHHQSLRLYERLLLEYWLGNYSNIILTMEIMSRAKSEEEPAFTRFYIPQDMLGYVLQSEIKKRYYEAIIQDYESLHFTPDINEFLYLLLNNLLRNQSQDELNLSADKFIKNYPSSLLVEPVKQYISYKIRPGKSGFEMGVAFGYAF